MENNDLVENLGNMTVLELIALTKKLEQKWDLKAEPQVVVQTLVPVEVKSVQTEFDVVLVSYAADKKISLIKVVRDLTGLGLKEAKDLVEAAPKAIKESLSKEEADVMFKKLIDAGGVAELK